MMNIGQEITKIQQSLTLNAHKSWAGKKLDEATGMEWKMDAYVTETSEVISLVHLAKTIN